mmetsp:Transcript_11243/g.39142  ORF Transcript_11243/g.39142 Transcript_11243/m.39142 type:complete len:216 (-) Transcript_11243:50-697(-)
MASKKPRSDETVDGARAKRVRRGGAAAGAVVEVDVVKEGNDAVLPPSPLPSSTRPLPPVKVVRMRRSGGVVVQDADIYIGRRMTMGGWRLAPSRYANPFSVKQCGGSADEACRRFEAWARERPSLIAALREELFNIASERAARGGGDAAGGGGATDADSEAPLTLGCWCKAAPAGARRSQACHGDVLVKLLGEGVGAPDGGARGGAGGGAAARAE